MTTLIEHFQLGKAIFFRICAIGHVDVARVLPLCMDLYISILMDILHSVHMKTVKFM